MSVNREQLRLVGPYHSHSGYSHFARAVLRAALVAGYEVEAIESDVGMHFHGDRDPNCGTIRKTWERIIPKPSIQLADVQAAELAAALDTKVAPDAPTILMQIPPNLGAWSKYGRAPLLGYTMSESDNIVPLWQHNMRCVDLLLAPSSYCLDTFKRVLPEIPSTLLAIPVDDRLWSAEEYTGEVHQRPKFLFFTAFNTQERKNWRLLMQAFAEEFAGEDMGLFLHPSRWPEVEQLARACRELGVWMYVDPEPCTDWVMGGLYRACDCYVQPSSEGFGLPYVEAGLCGKPSVALSLGGAADVVSEDCGYTVPSTMEPLIGHQPHWYPRNHRLASCTIDDLRTTLRRAYETERSGEGKRAAARQSMQERFTPEVIAPALRQAVDQAVSIHAANKLYSVAPPAPKWATASGAWGDVFACVGNIRKVMAERNLSKIGVVFAGRDPRIADWLRAQPWCGEVLHISAPDKPALDKMFARLSQCRPIHGQEEFRALAYEAGIHISPAEIAYTHLTMNAPQAPAYWHGAVLPDDARAWAQEWAPRTSFLLLNPLSIASNQFHDHWEYWTEATDWLLDNATCPVVLVGEQPIEWEHRNLVNVSGQSRTMMDVLALAELADGVVSTSNNLGIYAPIADIQSVIVCARTCHEESIYWAWMEREPISLLDYGASLGMFRDAVQKRFGRFLKPRPVSVHIESQPVTDAEAHREVVLA